MTMKKIFLITLFLMLTNCGYDAIYSKNNSLNVLVNKIETSGDKNINRIIVSSIKVEKEKENSMNDDAARSRAKPTGKCSQPIVNENSS